MRRVTRPLDQSRSGKQNKTNRKRRTMKTRDHIQTMKNIAAKLIFSLAIFAFAAPVNAKNPVTRPHKNTMEIIVYVDLTGYFQTGIPIFPWTAVATGHETHAGKFTHHSTGVD